MISRLKPIKNFSKYLISDKGIVYSLYSKKILKPGHDKDGYLRVDLWKYSFRHEGRIHRLVLETFIGPCPKDMESCHNNGNKLDNRLENLRWDTLHNNIKDSVKHGKHRSLHQYGENSAVNKLTKRDVINIICLWNTKLFRQWEIANMYNISYQTVSSTVLRKTWRHLWTKKNLNIAKN